MSQTIDTAFVKQYEADVHLAYQRKGSKLRNTIRTKNNIVGESTTFQKMGTGTAGTKTRHGDVPLMNIDHSNVECFLKDRYAADMVDKLDTYKIHHEERQALVDSGVYALGRATDSFIINDALAQATNQTLANVGTDTGMNIGKVYDVIEKMGARDVPIDDGRLTVVVGWKQWTELMDIDEFKSNDYVPESELPFAGRGTYAKHWLGAMWMPHSGLPKAGNDRSCFAYHHTAVGHAIAAEIMTDITWQGLKAAWLINNMMSQGAVLIDDNGVQEIICTE